MLKLMSTLDESWNQVTEGPCDDTELTSMDTQEVITVAKRYGEIKWLNQLSKPVPVHLVNQCLFVED